MAYPGMGPGNPTSRPTFKAYCLRRLGAPVMEINVEDDQVEDRIDDALQYFFDYHYNGTSEEFYKYQITDTDKVNGYITLPDNILGAVDIFPVSDSFGMGDMFNIQYQIALNDLYTLTSVSLVPYYMARQHLSQIEEVFVGKQSFRYNRYQNRVYIDTNWSILHSGQFLVIKAYQVIDPTQFTAMWSDRFLKEYATQQIKRQWGEHLKKFGNLTTAGGVVFNGQQIWNEADARIKEMEADTLRNTMPAMDMIG